MADDVLKMETVPEDEKKREPVIEEVPEPEVAWVPVTSLGKKVKEGAVTDIDEIFRNGWNILEARIVDTLLPTLEEDLLLIGQSKGKFGGGKRRIFKQTQKKTREGNKIQFMTCAIIGNKEGYVGIGLGKSKETVPARDKAKRNARLHVIRVRRGCGSWECHCKQPHSIPFEVSGRCGSTRITLIPAPKGKGLCVEKECAKVLALAGVRDIWCKTKGQTRTKLNMILALFDALQKLNRIKTKAGDRERFGIVDGSAKSAAGSHDASYEAS